MTDYRIEFSVQRRKESEDDFTEIGFGSSGSWGDVEQASSILDAMIQHREWETTADMPDPSETGQAL